MIVKRVLVELQEAEWLKSGVNFLVSVRWTVVKEKMQSVEMILRGRGELCFCGGV